MHNPLDLDAVAPLPVLLAALGPVMLKLAGERADGTVLWMADERAIGEHVAPTITKAAEQAGRAQPRIVAGIPVCLCAPSQVDEARERANRILGEAEISPNYQRLLDYGDIKDIGELCAVGDESAIAARSVVRQRRRHRPLGPPAPDRHRPRGADRLQAPHQRTPSRPSHGLRTPAP